MKLKTDGCSLSFVCFKERQLDYEKKKKKKSKRPTLTNGSSVRNRYALAVNSG